MQPISNSDPGLNPCLQSILSMYSKYENAGQVVQGLQNVQQEPFVD